MRATVALPLPVCPLRHLLTVLLNVSCHLQLLFKEEVEFHFLSFVAPFLIQTFLHFVPPKMQRP